MDLAALRTRRRLGFSLALAFWAFIVVVWPQSTDVENAPGVSRATVPGEALYKADLTRTNFGLLGVHLFESVENRRNWDIRAKFAELNRADDYFDMQQVNAAFYGQDTGNIVHTTSDYGQSYLGRNYVELEGNVKIISSKGYEFQMQRVAYNGAQRTFFTESPVHIIGPDVDNPTMLLEGVGMKGSADKEHFILQKNVQARRKMSTSEWLHIRSQSGEFFTQDQKAVFYRRVRSQMPRVTILSDRFELETGGENETIVATGNVTLYNRDRVGRADRATVQVAEDQILLEGQDGGAQVQTDGDTMRGDQILIYSQDDRVEVRSAKGTVKR